MADYFTDRMRLRGKAEEDLYFAELDKKLIEALHEKQAREQGPGGEQLDDLKHPDDTGANK